MKSSYSDLRFAFRTLLRNPLFALVAILTLALGIGINATIFSFANVLLIRPLPYEKADELVLVASTTSHIRRGSLSFPDFRDVREQSKVFESTCLIRAGEVNLTAADGEPERLSSLLVTADIFPTLGIRPILGRPISETDDRPGAGRTVLLSHQLWQKRFAGDPGVLGKAVTLDDTSYEVIGVLPAELKGESIRYDLGDVWIPFGLSFDQLPLEDRGAHMAMTVIARLKAGETAQNAALEMEQIASRLAAEYPDTNEGNGIAVDKLRDVLVSDVRPALLILILAAAFVLLITCANLASLLLARAAARPQEIAVRNALGASRRHLVRQLLIENFLIAALGAAVGLFLTYLGTKVVLTMLPQNVPHLDQVGTDLRVVLFTLGLALVTAVVFGLVPALQTARPNLQEVLSAGGGGRSSGGKTPQRLRHLLVTTELALSLLLLIGASLMLRSVKEFQNIDPGFEPENVVTMQIKLAREKYPDSTQWADFFDRTLLKVNQLPGVESAAVTSLLPLSFGRNMSRVIAEDSPPEDLDSDELVALFQAVSPDYFKTMGIPMLRGRPFTEQDRQGTGGENKIILNESLARRLWSDASVDPIGKRISFEVGDDDVRQWREVVGVVGDVQQSQLGAEGRINLYLPHTEPPFWWQNRWPTMALVAKAATAPMSLVPSIRGVIQEIDPNQPAFAARAMGDIVAGEYAYPRMLSFLLTVFAALALLQAVLGVYGVISYAVSQRRQEFGIRIALGASGVSLLQLVLRSGLVLVSVGAAIGLVSAFGLTRLMSSMLYGVAATDLLIFGGQTLLMILVGTISTLIPAWRSTKVDPVRALRYE